MLRYLPFLFVLLIYSCVSGPSHSMDEEEIDQYVESSLDTSIIYEIVQGLRYSVDDESYQVTEYSLYDTVILFNTQEITEFSTVSTNYYFKDELPIYIEEFIYEYPEDYSKISERKIYLTGNDVLECYERTGEYDYEVEEMEFELGSVNYSDYDFDRPKRAIEQSGEFELMYGEFLIINPESYLILENDKSGYGVALYIMEGDMLLDELFARPNDYMGKTIFAHHEFLMMNGIERMIYRGGIVKENEIETP